MFVVHGPVKHDSPVFVKRSAELATVEKWLARAGCVGAILGARQTGKTSFCYWLSAHLDERYAFAYVDFQGFDGTTWDECVRYIAEKLLRLCAGSVAPELPRKGALFARFLKRLAAQLSTVRIVVIFEELGDLPAKCRQRLAQSIRSVFTERLQEPAYERYAFLIVGAYEVRDMAGTRNSPLWNVAEKLYLEDFSRAQVADLLSAATDATEAGAERLSDFVYHWTSGHPYWTQRLGKELADSHVPGDPDFADIAAAEVAVRRLVSSEDTNLPHFFEELERERAYLRSIIDKILSTEYEFSRFDKGVATLELLGAVANRQGQCVIRNRIYEYAMAELPAGLGLGHSLHTDRATLLNVDMIGYSEVARYLEYVLNANAVGLLGESIRTQIVAGLKACGLDESAIYGTTGDGAILRFATAALAHEFARCFSAVVDARNRDIPDRALWREYRMGAATGDIAPVGDGASGDRAGLVFTRSQRLESKGAPGQLLVDVPTFRALPEELAGLYGPEEDLEVKHGVHVAARRWIITERGGTA